MRSSHLTRSVFRAILANQPYSVQGCHRRTIKRASPFQVSRSTLGIQKRLLFTALLGTVNLQLDGARATPKNLEVALGKLVDLIRARRSNSRTPPDDELLSAFKFVFRARLETKRKLTRNEVFLATETFKYFEEKGLVRHVSDKSALGTQDLHTILSTLALPSGTERFRSDFTTLASLVFKSLEPLSTTSDHGIKQQDNVTSLLTTYITVLAKSGSAIEALKLLKGKKAPQAIDTVQLWIEVTKGLANEGRDAEFKGIISELQQRFRQLGSEEYENLLSFLANGNKLGEARQLYDAQVKSRVKFSSRELCQLIELCARHNDREWGQELAQMLKSRTKDEGVIGSFLIWLAADQVGPALIVSRAEQFLDGPQIQSTSIDAFNHLYEFGLQQRRSDIMAAAIELADAFDIRPNGMTFALQLKNALEMEDVLQAKLIYEQMMHQDVPPDDSDVPMLNKFLAAITFEEQPPYTLIMRVVDSILERNADFDAEALAGLCKVFLQRDELEDATGMLRYRADFYPGIDRARIAAVFKDFILDPSNSDQRAFNAYEIYRFAFPETPLEEKLAIMQSFFDRKRADLACIVFGHMRQREDLDARPTSEAYSQCFAGIAKCRDIDGLQIVHNMLKLDLEVEPTTRIRNAMMLAYIACNLPFTAMIDNFWKVMDSHEGPSYSTFEIGLRACETWVPQGGYEARKIMAIVQAWNLEVTKELYECYVGALAGQSEFEYTIELIEEMENDIGERPDAITIGTFYNAIPWQYRKDEVEKWAKKAYPDLWQELLEYGDEIDEEWEMRFFKIPRDIEIDDAPLFATGKYDPQISRQAVQALEPPST